MNGSPFFSLDHGNNPAGAESPGFFPIYLIDHIAFLKTSLLGRGSFHDTGNHRHILLLVERNISSDPVGNTIVAIHNLFQLLCGIVLRIRIIQRLCHTLIDTCLQVLLCRRLILVIVVIFFDYALQAPHLLYGFCIHNTGFTLRTPLGLH